MAGLSVLDWHRGARNAEGGGLFTYIFSFATLRLWATVAILINAIAPTLAAQPGLLTPTGKSIAEISWRCAVDLGY